MATQIHVVLQDDVANLGTGGDVVRVRPGFARNFLIPRQLAVPATSGNLARVEELKRAAEARAKTLLGGAQDLAKKIEAATVRIARAVGEEGKMYGSVTSRDVEEAYAKAGFEIDRKRMELAAPLRTLGTFEIPIRLHRDVMATLKVEVIAEPG